MILFLQINVCLLLLFVVSVHGLIWLDLRLQAFYEEYWAFLIDSGIEPD